MQTHQHTHAYTLIGSFEAGDVACLIASRGEKFNLELFDFTSIKQTNKKPRLMEEKDLVTEG